jgi:hypothetical protein
MAKRLTRRQRKTVRKTRSKKQRGGAPEGPFTFSTMTEFINYCNENRYFTNIQVCEIGTDIRKNRNGNPHPADKLIGVIKLADYTDAKRDTIQVVGVSITNDTISRYNFTFL